MCILDSTDNHYLLCITPFTNLIPFFIYIKNQEFHWIQVIVHKCILCLLITSVLFWYNPIKYGWSHYLDKCVVVFFCILSIGYVLFCKNMHRVLWFLYGCVLTFGIYFLCMSNYYSSLEWCSREHILYHLGFHFFGNTGIWFVFL
jgi:hypothetical protein